MNLINKNILSQKDNKILINNTNTNPNKSNDINELIKKKNEPYSIKEKNYYPRKQKKMTDKEMINYMYNTTKKKYLIYQLKMIIIIIILKEIIIIIISMNILQNI